MEDESLREIEIIVELLHLLQCFVGYHPVVPPERDDVPHRQPLEFRDVCFREEALVGDENTLFHPADFYGILHGRHLPDVPGKQAVVDRFQRERVVEVKEYELRLEVYPGVIALLGEADVSRLQDDVRGVHQHGAVPLLRGLRECVDRLAHPPRLEKHVRHLLLVYLPFPANHVRHGGTLQFGRDVFQRGLEGYAAIRHHDYELPMHREMSFQGVEHPVILQRVEEPPGKPVLEHHHLLVEVTVPAFPFQLRLLRGCKTFFLADAPQDAQGDFFERLSVLS